MRRRKQNVQKFKTFRWLSEVEKNPKGYMLIKYNKGSGLSCELVAKVGVENSINTSI